MKSLTKKLIIATATLALVGTGTMIAQASWTIPGTAKVKAKAAAMPRGAVPSAAKQGGNALISWSAEEIAPGVRMQTYVVTAHSADDPPRADIARTVTATSADTLSATFGGSVLTGGKWYWTLVPKYALWAGAESKKSDKLTFPAAADSRSVTSLVADSAPQAAAPAPSTTTPAAAADPPKETDPAPPVAATPPAETPKPVEQTSSPTAAPATSDPAPAETATTAAATAPDPPA
jgi:hypothetical protein